MDILNHPEVRIILQFLLALLLGGVIGLDRELSQKPAGLRTHMLVSGAAALLVSLGVALFQHYVEMLGDKNIASDPLRVIGAIITGVSFLGAGTILRNREGPVEGLTTAASLLTAATIGIAVGVNMYYLAVAASLIVVVILTAGLLVEQWMGVRRSTDE